MMNQFESNGEGGEGHSRARKLYLNHHISGAITNAIQIGLSALYVLKETFLGIPCSLLFKLEQLFKLS